MESRLHKPYVSLWHDTNHKIPTRVTANTATAIDHIIINVIRDAGFKNGSLKSCISDHFAI